MLLIFRTIKHPPPQYLDLFRPQRLARVSRRHVLIRIIACNSLDQFTVTQFLSVDNSLGAVQISHAIPNIKPQIGLALGRVRTVAMKAVVGQNRSNIARNSPPTPDRPHQHAHIAAIARSDRLEMKTLRE